MSLSSTTTIKNQLNQALGPKAPVYYQILQDYFKAAISRVEFDDQIKECLGKDNIPLSGPSHYLLRNIGLLKVQCNYTTRSLFRSWTRRHTWRHLHLRRTERSPRLGNDGGPYHIRAQTKQNQICCARRASNGGPLGWASASAITYEASKASR